MANELTVEEYINLPTATARYEALGDMTDAEYKEFVKKLLSRANSPKRVRNDSDLEFLRRQAELALGLP